METTGQRPLSVSFCLFGSDGSGSCRRCASGAAATGDGWLLGNYGFLAAAVLALTSVLEFFFLWEEMEDGIFVCNGERAGFGILYLFVLPPLSAPDGGEPLYRCLQAVQSDAGENSHEEHGLVYLREEV